MEVKQEPVDSFEETVIIKQEPVFINPENIIKVEHDWASQLSPMGAVPILRQEPQVEALLESSLNDICEVTASDYFVNTSDIVSIKRENPEFDINVDELLTAQCDLPTLKNETIDYYDQPCSSKQAQELSPQKKHARKKVGKIKRKRRYPCPICRKSPMKQKHFNQHFKTYVICALCGQFFVRKKEFLTHYFNHIIKRSKIIYQVNTTKKQNYSEIIYKESKSSLSAYFIEKKCSKKVSGICKLCFKFYKYLYIHLTQGACSHLFKCEICFKRCKTPKKLQNHMRNHDLTKLFTCEFCLNVYSNTYKKSHMLTHTDPKQFQCDICFKVLYGKYSLDNHKKIHTYKVAEFFECELCPTKFTTKVALSNHKTTHKKNLNNETIKLPFSYIATPTEYKCENCYIKFKSKEIYDKHLALNRLEKPCNCEICSELFTSKCHSFTHSTNNVHLQCPFCIQTCQGKQLLTRHINESHKNNKMFQSKQMLTPHINETHKANKMESPQVKENILSILLNYKKETKPEISE